METSNEGRVKINDKEFVGNTITFIIFILVSILLSGAIVKYSNEVIIQQGVEKLITSIRVAHILSGIGCLAFGLGAMLTTKGGKRHRLFGKIYFWCMLVIFVTAIPITLYKDNIFFFFIGFLSFYPAMAGYRVLFQKKLNQGQKPMWYDYLIIVITMIVMLVGFYVAFQNLSSNLSIGIILMALCTTGILSVLRNITRYRKQPVHKGFWLLVHIGEMSGSYIAACTAFLVNNSKYFPGINEIVLWLSPAIIGGILIRINLQRQRKKMGIIKN
jgi:uncharacterized membrane protein